jgi:hypothetical protein
MIIIPIPITTNQNSLNPKTFTPTPAGIRHDALIKIQVVRNWEYYLLHNCTPSGGDPRFATAVSILHSPAALENILSAKMEIKRPISNHPTFSPSHLRIFSSSHHLIFSPSHLLTISSSHHLPISPSHHLTISPQPSNKLSS